VSVADEHAERFTHLRPLLFTIAYEILGSATESDDVLQDSYLRWAEVDLTAVRDTKAYLARLVTRQALNARRAEARRREYYFGPWLPEPILVTEHDGAADVVLAEWVSMGMLVLLETLTPNERAVFVLREVFGFDYDDIAPAVGKSLTAVHQMAHRAREHIQARRKRLGPVNKARTAAVTEQFLTAAATGDMAGLLSLLAPDITWTTDSGGKVPAVRHLVMTDAKEVASMFLALFREMRRRPGFRIEVVSYNSQPAMSIHLGKLGESVCLLEISDGKITHGFTIRNPEKLTALTVPRAIARSDAGPFREP